MRKPSSPAWPHLRRQGTAAQLIVNGSPFLLLAGEVHNSSASSLPYMETVFDRLASLQLNTVLTPLYWELIEPEEGRFDFTLLDGLIAGARRRGMRLVFLWFGTLKNAVSSYAPPWVKTDLERFPRAESKPGERTTALSVFCDETARCDARAFAAVMTRIREVDRRDHTVLMMQVENEPGILGTSRDRGAAAERALAGPVPATLCKHLSRHRASLRPELLAAWARAGSRQEGSWSQLFGAEADEVFMAWHTARFLERVAAAGRRAYDLPMYANAWLVSGPDSRPGQYPSGGPVSRMLDVWRAAAPHLDLLAPDIYLPDFRGVCADYTQSGNPLFIPEARNGRAAAANALYAFARHDAIGFSPFAIDDLTLPHPLPETYATLADMMPVLTAAQGTGRMTAFLQQEETAEWTADLDGFRFTARTRRRPADSDMPGCALLLSLGDGEFVAAGTQVTLSFAPADMPDRKAELLWLDEGRFDDGRWLPERRLNGDETFHGTGTVFGDSLKVCRLKLHTY